MFPGLGGMDPRRMKAMMRQLGIKSEDIDAERVVFELSSGKRLVVDSPQVSAVDMGGQKTYTVMGEAREEKGGATGETGGTGQDSGGEEEVDATGQIPESDIDMVAQQAGVGREKAKKALEETEGDIAEAINRLGK